MPARSTVPALAAVLVAGALAVPAQAGYTPPGLVSCPVDQPTARNGRKPPKRLMVKIMQCGWEQPASSAHEANDMVVESYRLGEKRKWRQSADGFGDVGSGRPGTWVWSIKVTWSLYRYYADRTVKEHDIAIWSCFVTTLREWDCGIAQTIKRFPIEYLPPKTGR